MMFLNFFEVDLVKIRSYFANNFIQIGVLFLVVFFISIGCSDNKNMNQITSETPVVFSPTATTRPQQQIKTSRHDMNEIRQEHTATLLKDGTVLVAGGSNSIGPQPWVEIYDPSIDTWTTVSRMNDARVFHTATLLQDGNVLV